MVLVAPGIRVACSTFVEDDMVMLDLFGISSSLLGM